MFLKLSAFCCAALGVALLSVKTMHAQEAPPDSGLERGHVSQVVAYRGQALVTREIDVKGGLGPMEILVSDLPSNVFPDSLYADGSNGVQVRAVRYRTRVSGTDSREDVQAVLEAIDELEMRMRENDALQNMTHQQLAYIDKLENFVAPTAMVELGKGVLNAEQLKALSSYAFEKREQLVRAQLDLEKTAISLFKDHELLTARLNKLGASDNKLLREAVVFIDKSRDEATSIDLNYLVGGVHWRPTYNLRAESGRDALEIEYSALVMQTSGEDWTGVDLTLSTASPALIAQGAALAPMLVSLTHPGGSNSRVTYGDANEWAAARSELRERQLRAAQSDMLQHAESHSPTLGSYRKQSENISKTLNSIANELQEMEFDANRELLKHVVSTPEGVSVEYKIDGATSLQSRDDQQLVSIADIALDASFAHIATPILSDYVYLQAEAKNASDTVLLEGDYSAYLDGRFVGRAALPMVARGESFAAGFGIDSQLRVSRELISKDSVVRGGNRETTFSYRVLVENFKDRDVALRLFDRMPYAEREDIQITLQNMSHELSKDRMYLRDQHSKGILRWDIEVKAGSFDADSMEITYSFVVEHDKQMELATSAVMQ